MRVYERMYTRLLNGILESLNVLSPVKTKQALQALCLLKTAIKEAEEIFILIVGGTEVHSTFWGAFTVQSVIRMKASLRMWEFWIRKSQEDS